ncbi:hypothetical protein ACFQZS_13770 [Mucilaginibacter calamicampi]|uniref:Outer membrane protein beta-barrel domain-containing protein n=2 Tax=Mucilaginibacter calamicampi TaxID=1302352 RepID=A0ABW2YXJ5_9SPHI
MYLSLKRVIYSLAIPVFYLMVNCFSAQAQHRSVGMNADGNVLGGSKSGGGGAYLPTEGWFLAVNGGYEAPLGEMRDIYKPAPTFGVTLMKKWNHLVISGTVDYRNNQPKQSSFPLDIDINGQTATGEVTYGNFSGIGIYAGVSYEALITPGASFYVGVNGGTIISKYDYAVSYEGIFAIADQAKVNITYIGPKLGLNFAINSRISLGAEARYSVSLSKADQDPSSDTVSKGFNSVAGNLVLRYGF